jgi:hypothetical protein
MYASLQLQQTLIPTLNSKQTMKDQNEKEMEEKFAKKSFRPAMNTAEDPEHEQHIKKLRELNKKA